MADTIAVLGTGTMGAPMARNLLKGGFTVRVWNRTRARAEPLVLDGASVHDTAAEAVSGADVVITMLMDAASVKDAVDEDVLSAIGDDAVWAQMATVGVAGWADLEALATTHAVAIVDAPVLGTRKPAEDGTLKVLAAGSDRDVERCRPAFEAIGTVSRVGELGAGSRLKLVANAWVLAITDATASSISLARGLGLDPQAFLDVIEGSATDSPYAHVKGAAMIKADYPASFGLDGAAKDAGLIIEAAASVGVDAELTAVVRAHLLRAAAAGFGQDDLAAVIEGH